MKEQLTKALKQALLARDETRKRTLRLALAAIKNAEVDSRADLDEPEILSILQKEVKLRRETIEGAEQAGREDLITEALAEIKVLEEFLPAPLDEQELKSMAQEAIREVGAETPREMGRVMQVIMPRVAGRADGKEVSQVVRQLLSK